MSRLLAEGSPCSMLLLGRQEVVDRRCNKVPPSCSAMIREESDYVQHQAVNPLAMSVRGRGRGSKLIITCGDRISIGICRNRQCSVLTASPSTVATWCSLFNSQCHARPRHDRPISSHGAQGLVSGRASAQHELVCRDTVECDKW